MVTPPSRTISKRPFGMSRLSSGVSNRLSTTGSIIGISFLSSFPDLGTARHRKIHGIRDETEVIHPVVQTHGQLPVRPAGHGDSRLKRDLREATATVRGLDHRAGRVVLVFGHPDSRVGAKVQVPEHVTC